MSTPTPYWGRNDEPLKSRGAPQGFLIILEKLDNVAPDPTPTRSDVTAPVGALLALGWTEEQWHVWVLGPTTTLCKNFGSRNYRRNYTQTCLPC